MLKSIQRPVKVAFYNRDGEKTERGISVGNFTNRGYISGSKESKAVISIAGVTESDLVDGSLILDAYLDVFLTHRLKTPFCDAQAFLQTSDGKIHSSFVEIKARSLAEHTLRFPRELPVFDVDSGDAKGTADLIDTFASNGSLQVVLQCLEKSSYIGLQDSDIGLRLPRYEFLGTNGQFVVVAQSKDSLKQMLELSPQELAEKIALQEGQQVTASFNLNSDANRRAFKYFLNSMKMQHAIFALSPSSRNVRLSVNMDRDCIFSTRIGMSEHDATNKAKQITDSLKILTSPRDSFDSTAKHSYALDGESGKILGELPAEVYQSVLTQDSLASLRAIVLNMAFGMQDMDVPLTTQSDAATFPGGAIDRVAMASLYQKLFEDLASGVRSEGAFKDLAIEFHWPFDEPGELDQMEQIVFATPRRYRAHEHNKQQRFFLGEQIERRLIDDFPEEAGLWTALAHQLSYNVSMEFEADAAKYTWVRKGINVLLDVAEADENSIDATWMAAIFISAKIGTSDEETSFRKLFTKDRELLDRISKYIDLNQCLDESGAPDCLLIGRSLAKYCSERIDNNKLVKSNLSQLEIAVQPINMLLRHARWLDKLQPQAANKQWQQALVEWEKLASEHDDTAPSKRANANWYKTRTKSIQFRLSPAGQAIARHIAEANVFREADNLESALDQAKLALKLIRKKLEAEPEANLVVNQLFDSFLTDAEYQYRKLDKSFSNEIRDFRRKLMTTQSNKL